MTKAEVKTIIHQSGNPVKILLQKRATGFDWEIHVAGSDPDKILAAVEDVNNKLKAKFGGA
jgi:hypothetical protein